MNKRMRKVMQERTHPKSCGEIRLFVCSTDDYGSDRCHHLAEPFARFRRLELRKSANLVGAFEILKNLRLFLIDRETIIDFARLSVIVDLGESLERLTTRRRRHVVRRYGPAPITIARTPRSHNGAIVSENAPGNARGRGLHVGSVSSRTSNTHQRTGTAARSSSSTPKSVADVRKTSSRAARRTTWWSRETPVRGEANVNIYQFRIPCAFLYVLRARGYVGGWMRVRVRACNFRCDTRYAICTTTSILRMSATSWSSTSLRQSG
ncbi:hypothetical protein DBV15_08055 [Temnothorax longispinosus]|uniref:Uncharacterized protein n=1 Tax=Temnothorax longispinosus TaxID=300112 RepID=A0A4S2KLP1_9HYME|nr:hypothetical protein DBV15_08055 [Temnothorax longispinosus]